MAIRIAGLARAYAIDLIAVALAIGSIYEGTVSLDTENAWAVAVFGPFALALIARRWLPLMAPLTVFAGIAIMAPIAPHAIQESNSPFLAVIVSAGVIGAYNELRPALAGFAATIAAVFWVNTRVGDASAGDYIWPIFFFGSAWMIGLLLSQRTRSMSELKERAARLEREREDQARAAVAEERARIARELHDMVGHSVSVMTVQASAVRRLLKPEQETEREALRVVEETGRQALAEMRRLVGVLRRPEEGPALAPQPSLEHLDKLLAQVREAGLSVELQVEGDECALPPGIDLTAYRVIQEALTNTLKHANAHQAEVVVRYVGDGVELVVTDDGRGEGSSTDGGHGLVGMRERVAVCGGRLDAGPRNGGGFELRARLPASAA